MKKNWIKVAAMTGIALALVTPAAFKMTKNYYDSALQAIGTQEESSVLPSSPSKVPYAENTLTEAESLAILIENDEEPEQVTMKEAADFILYSLQSRKEGPRMKILLEYGQKSDQTVTGPLDWRYNFTEGNRTTSLVDRDETREYLSGVIYKRSFFVEQDVEGLEVIIDPEERINDRDRRNNRKNLPLITDQSRPEGVDLFIARISSRPEKTGLKVFLEIGQSGDSVVDLKGLEVKFFLPYQDQTLFFEQPFSGYLNPGDKVSFTTFLAHSAQGGILRVLLDPQNKFNDLNRENNFKEERLASLQNDYLDWKLEKAAEAVVEKAGEKLRKIYLEYRHDGDSLDLYPQIKIVNSLNNEIVWFEEKISGKLIGPEKDRLRAYELFLPYHEEENDLFLEIADSQGRDDPITANNKLILIPKE